MIQSISIWFEFGFGFRFGFFVFCWFRLFDDSLRSDRFPLNWFPCDSRRFKLFGRLCCDSTQNVVLFFENWYLRRYNLIFYWIWIYFLEFWRKKFNTIMKFTHPGVFGSISSSDIKIWTQGIFLFTTIGSRLSSNGSQYSSFLDFGRKKFNIIVAS